MHKAYVIARVDIIDPESYAVYAPLATEALKKSGGRVLARGGRYEALEGQARARNVVIEFDSFDAARNCYFSDLYQTAKAKRDGAAIAEFVLVEAYDPISIHALLTRIGSRRARGSGYPPSCPRFEAAPPVASRRVRHDGARCCDAHERNGPEPLDFRLRE
jgi:uncharacterized protein (DUF1330 family)